MESLHKCALRGADFWLVLRSAPELNELRSFSEWECLKKRYWRSDSVRRMTPVNQPSGPWRPDQQGTPSADEIVLLVRP